MRRRNVQSLVQSLFWHIYDQPLVPRTSMAKRFGTSRASLCRAVTELLEKGLIIEVSASNGLRGRHPRLLKPNPSHGYLLGLDMQVNGVTAVITDIMGSPLGRGSISCDARTGTSPVLEASQAAAQMALEDAGIPHRRLRDMGIGFSGEVDPETGACTSWLNAPVWKGVPVRKLYEDTFGLNVKLGDRGSAFALGQRRLSPEDWSHSDALYVICSDGIGLGIFIDGRHYLGARRVAGEFGHTVIDSRGPRCRCGRVGCIEATAGVVSIIRHVQASLRAGERSALPPSATRRLTIDEVAEAARNGDPLASEALHRAAAALGTGIVNAVHVLNPSLVVLCGKLARVAGAEILSAANRAFDKECIAAVSRSVEIRVATPKKDVAAVGCALLAAESAAERAVASTGTR